MNDDDRKRRILCVDDEDFNLAVLSGFIRRLGHEPVTAGSGEEAKEFLDESIDLVLSDVMMPGMDGFSLVEWIRTESPNPDVPVIMVTTLTEKGDRLRAVQAGANDYVTKPVDLVELRIRSDSLLKMKDSQDVVKLYQRHLEEMIEERTKSLHDTLKRLRTAHIEIINRLSVAAEFRDEDTASHINRMSHISGLLARKMGMTEYEVDTVLHASPMHDVGKIGVPDAILFKPGPLSPEEWVIMKRHTEFGGKILDGGDSDLLQLARVIALSHHEKWDGSGYPNGLKGEDIPLVGRICAVADVFDALMSERPYKKPFSLEKSLDIMRQGRGSHFDPRVLDAFLDNLDEALSIRHQFNEQ
ncbi:MAG: response regulator [Deltaproteobacteria bacterium]|nr:response regulator [Deltaproteobacteria bacterium]